MTALLDAMAHDTQATVSADRGDRLDSTLEAVEDVGRAAHRDLKRLVVFVAAVFAPCHFLLPSVQIEGRLRRSRDRPSQPRRLAACAFVMLRF